MLIHVQGKWDGMDSFGANDCQTESSIVGLDSAEPVRPSWDGTEPCHPVILRNRRVRQITLAGEIVKDGLTTYLCNS